MTLRFYPALPARRFALVPFGAYTRLITLAHARHIATVVTALMIIALTLDLAPRAERIAAQSADRSVIGLVVHFLWYLALRIVDLAGNLMPLGCFMGLYWSEITLTQLRERIVIANGGRTPLQTLMPLVLLGLIFGALQVTLLMVARPAAVATQIASSLGEYGKRFDRSLKPDDWRWLTLFPRTGSGPVSGHMVRARIDYRAARLVEPQLFAFSADGRLVGRLEAAEGVPAGPGLWRFVSGSRWDAAEGTTTGTSRRFAEEVIALPLDPLWLTTVGIDARYLPQATLAALAETPGLPEGASYRSWWHVRIGQVILPFGMMVIASALAMTLIGQRTAFRPMILIGLAGYFLYVATNIVVWLGEYGQVPPLVAAWAMPGAMVATGLLLMKRLERR